MQTGNTDFIYRNKLDKACFEHDMAYGPLTKNKERIEKFMQTGNTVFIYRNELDKACCFDHDMAYGKTKDLAKRTQ